MNNGLTRQWRIAAAVALCAAASTLFSGPLHGPGVALATEAEQTPAEDSIPPDNAGDAAGQSESSPDAEHGASKDTPDMPDADKSEEVFVPSEDISEDIDVPFPVDI